ncbi:MAG: NFACT RNA binding domain-containing protein [Desulfovibrio sp.]|jgi:predicted ribosome quality control (RQC) complex YloA/Tae2 family protein|nr:NFACT RNA binding domain-containing protein [Desulfovibrio sp.]
MDAHLFIRFCTALKPLLLNARLEKIQEPFPAFLTLTLSALGRKRQLCWHHGKQKAFCFLSATRLSANNTPSAQIMRLRKYAGGRRIRSVVAQFGERRLWLLVGCATPLKEDSASQAGKRLVWLCLDLRLGASLHFITAESTPEEESLPWPNPDNLGQALADWRQWPILTPALRRTLTHLDERERAALLVDLKEGGGNVFAYHCPDRRDIRSASAWPLPLALRGDLEEQQDEDVLALLEQAGREITLANFSREKERAELQSVERQSRKLERLRLKFQEEEIRLTAMTGARADALALWENLWRLPAEARGGKVAVPAGIYGIAREIHLAPGRSARQEMEALFRTAKRGRRGLEHLARRRADLERELNALAPARPAPLRQDKAGAGNGRAVPSKHPLVKNLPKNVRAFISDDGFVMLRGRDAAGNLAALKFAEPHDIWLHAENGPGAHVVIRRACAGQDVPERTLVQAGILAASKSWAAGAGKASVIYAEARHVKRSRKAPAGAVRVDKIYCSRLIDIDLIFIL